MGMCTKLHWRRVSNRLLSWISQRFDGTGEIRLLILWSLERFHKLTKSCMTSAICRENREQQIDFTLKYSIDKIYMQPVKHSVLNGLERTVRMEKHTVGIEIYP